MEYSISESEKETTERSEASGLSESGETERSEAKLGGVITFKWTVQGKDFNYEKSIAFSVNEMGCYIPEIESRTWGGIGVMTIKEAMGLPDNFCCCNPDHTEDNLASMSIEFGRRISKEVHLRQPFVKSHPPFAKAEQQQPQQPIPTKEKISGVDKRKKLSDIDIVSIKQSPLSDIKLAEIYGVSRDYVNKVRRGMYRGNI